MRGYVKLLTLAERHSFVTFWRFFPDKVVPSLGGGGGQEGKPISSTATAT